MVQELMALRATLEPMLMRAVREAMMNDRKTARRGMFQPGWTCKSG